LTVPAAEDYSAADEYGSAFSPCSPGLDRVCVRRKNRKPASACGRRRRIGSQPFPASSSSAVSAHGLLPHALDLLRGFVGRPFADGLKNARFRYAPKMLAPWASRTRHVERDGLSDNIGGRPRPWRLFPRRSHGDHRARGTMGEQRHAAIMVKTDDEGPQFQGVFRNLACPRGVPVGQ